MISTFILLSIITSYMPIRWYPKKYKFKLYNIKKRTGLSPGKYFLKIAKYYLHKHSNKLKRNRKWYSSIMIISFIPTRFLFQIAIKLT